MRGLDDVTCRVAKPPVSSGNHRSEVGVLCGINATARPPSATDHAIIRSNFMRSRTAKILDDVRENLAEIFPFV
jgi:hypothetical protein